MKTAMVTGATSGIGRAIALQLANDYEVVCVGRDKARGSATVKEIEKNGGKANFIAADVSEPKQVADLFKNIKHLDVLVNAAGVEIELKDPLDSSEWDKTFKTNLYGAVEMIRHSLKIIKNGVIVNIGSLVGAPGVVFPTYSLPYEASKAALHKVTESIAVTHAPNIRAITISPGYVDTPIWDIFTKEMKDDATKLVPIARFLRPEEIAKAVSAVIENEAFNGVTITVDGGLSLRKID